MEGTRASIKKGVIRKGGGRVGMLVWEELRRQREMVWMAEE